MRPKFSEPPRGYPRTSTLAGIQDYPQDHGSVGFRIRKNCFGEENNCPQVLFSIEYCEIYRDAEKLNMLESLPCVNKSLEV